MPNFQQTHQVKTIQGPSSNNHHVIHRLTLKLKVLEGSALGMALLLSGSALFPSGSILSAAANETLSAQAAPVLPPPPTSIDSDSEADNQGDSAPIETHQEQLIQPSIIPSGGVFPNNTTPLPIDAVAAPNVTINDYILGVGDHLQIEVFESPEYSGEFEVLADGTIRMPFVDAVQARGRTIEQTAALISQQYAPILRRPLVSIRVLESRPINLVVTGEVNRPGAIRVSLNDTDGPPTVTQALQLAEGITQSANVRSIQVQRFSGNRSEPPTVIAVNLWQLLQDADLSQDIALQDGDRIIVPEAPVLFLDESAEIADANFSPATITVNVVGEVGSPGVIEVPPNTSLNEAILRAGGFTRNSRRRRVDLVQANPNGTITNREIDVDLSASPNNANNPVLRPNDTVVVGRSAFARITGQISQALSPAAAIFSLIRIFN